MPEEPEYLDPRTERQKNKRNLVMAAAFVGLVALVLAAVVFIGMRRSRKVAAAAAATTASASTAANPKMSTEMRELLNTLRANPKDVAANRQMADKAEAANSKAALNWRRKVVDLEPENAENHLALANTAVRFRDLAAAKEALDKVPEEGRNTVGYHEAAMRLALVSRDPKTAEAAVAAAIKLDPEKESNQLTLALIQLNSTDPKVRTEARKAVEAFATKPALQRNALRPLINLTLQEKNYRKALEYGRQLRTATGATFADGVYYLSLLRQFKRPEFWWCLAQLTQEGAADAAKAAELMFWLNRNGLAQKTLDWVKQLPANITSKLTVVVAHADAAASEGQWAAVKALVENGNWERLEFRRLALLARAQRAEGADTEAQTGWMMAVESAETNKQALTELARLANDWAWDHETVELLWRLARDPANPLPALADLQKKLLVLGDTRQLRDVSVRILELQPKDLGARNNQAYYDLLLKDEVDRGLALAREVYQEAPKIPAVVATYAFALHVDGKNDEARKLLQAQDEKTLSEPGQALCYGLVLAATGAADEARKYFDIARRGKLLPEEKELIPKAE